MFLGIEIGGTKLQIGLGLGDEDFAKLIVLQARASGLDLEPENVPVSDGLT